ncbi:hypothetical protein ACJIZ3_010436 [Penstemon smallii]|uniref:Molybdenum cofactor sulfurase n=1 Tax=Penstemon smallii TaxID=265156 RepID=A0ABD3TFB1_9LAMI
MVQNIEEQASPESKDVMGESLLSSMPNSPTNQNQNSRPSSMVFKKPHMIPAHLVAEAISTLHGLDLRWSGPITPSEMQYVQQYVFAKYPEYCNGLAEENDNKIDEESSSESVSDDHKKKSPKNPSFSISDMTKIQLEPSKLVEILTKKSSFQGNFISIPEIQARNRALTNCGLQEEDYLVIFTPSVKEAMIMVGESYPFFRGNYYMTVLGEEFDSIREFVTIKDSKFIAAPETWLDLRIKGSQLSQYFRRKCKHCPKGLFAYPVCTNGGRSSMHWISEAHRNSWHVLLDASGLDVGNDRLALALHRPDFVVCVVDVVTHGLPSKITCLLVRKSSFDTATTSG